MVSSPGSFVAPRRSRPRASHGVDDAPVDNPGPRPVLCWHSQPESAKPSGNTISQGPAGTFTKRPPARHQPRIVTEGSGTRSHTTRPPAAGPAVTGGTHLGQSLCDEAPPAGRSRRHQAHAREEMTKSGIVLPDTAKEKPQEGTILAVGPGQILDDGKREAMDVKERRQGPLRQVRRDRVQGRRRGAPHRQPEGHPRDRRGLTPRRRTGACAPSTPASTSRRDTRLGQATHLRRDRSSLAQARHRPPRRRRQGHDRPQGPQRRARQEVRLADDHQRRRDDRPRHRARGPVREHGRAAPQGSRDQDRRRRRRRHDHRGRARPGDGRRGPPDRHRRRQPDGRQARHREGRRRRSSPRSSARPARSTTASRSPPSRPSAPRIPRSARSSPR